jgi:phage tail protein X
MLRPLVHMAVGALFLALLAGCSDRMAEMRENRDPLIRKGRDLRAGGEIDLALKAYNEALNRRGDMPQAHFETAVIYHQQKHDFIRAIYHYQRFLELSPDSKKRPLVEAEIQRARLEFAASLPQRPSEAVQAIATMEKEREMLRSRITDLQRQIDRLSGRTNATVASASAASPGTSATGAPVPAAAAVATNAAPRAATATVYVVQPGDTLAKIARGQYRDAGMANAIFEANRSILRTERDLKPGQQLTLPARQTRGGG